jgi:hypothetical protein
MYHTQTFIQALKKSSGNGRSKRQNKKFITSSRNIILELVTNFSFCLLELFLMLG